MIHLDRDPMLKAYLVQAGLKALGFDPGELDNWWGAKSEAAYQAFRAAQVIWTKAVASLFADPTDIAKFKKCKAEGHTDLYCFGPGGGYGDNGIGASGKITSQTLYPMVALHPLDIRSKYGDMTKAWGKSVALRYKDKLVIATLEDYMSSTHAQIDLNPAANMQLGHSPGDELEWRWL